MRPSTSNSKTTFLRLFAIACAGLAALFAGSAYAQTDQGTITGVVQDTSGAVIPEAQVTVTNVDTGLSLETKSNRSGIGARLRCVI